MSKHLNLLTVLSIQLNKGKGLLRERDIKKPFLKDINLLVNTLST